MLFLLQIHKCTKLKSNQLDIYHPEYCNSNTENGPCCTRLKRDSRSWKPTSDAQWLITTVDTILRVYRARGRNMQWGMAMAVNVGVVEIQSVLFVRNWLSGHTSDGYERVAGNQEGIGDIWRDITSREEWTPGVKGRAGRHPNTQFQRGNTTT